MSSNRKSSRPVNINLLKISLPMSAMSSITHRLSGMYIFFITLPLSLLLLNFTTFSEQEFIAVQILFINSLFFRTFVSFSLLVFIYHLLTGFRHLLMDFHIGESLKAAQASSVLVFSVWGLLAIYVWLEVII